MKASLLLLFVVSAVALLHPRQHRDVKYTSPSVSVNPPLFISQYLPDHPDEARKLSEVHGVSNHTSYSGYITVDKELGSNMFFWFFPAQNGDQNAPLLLWLQGGPGGSSMFGLFSENGPFKVASDAKTLIPNPYTWNAKYSMLYIDNPVGTGFSFTERVSGFSRNEEHVARNLHSALEQFFSVFYEYKTNEFYITGESYAGKYIPATAYYIHHENKKGGNYINLKGISIGDGAIDPLTQFTGMSELMYNVGFADWNEKTIIEGYENRIMEYIAATQWKEAFLVFDEMLNGDFFKYGTYFHNITGLSDYFNMLSPTYPPNPYPQYLNSESTRNAIHVGNYPFFDGNSTVEVHLINDWMQSMTPLLPTLFENYKVLIYNGQLDLILGPALTERSLRILEWNGHDKYNAADKIIWKVGNDVAGYAREVNNFRQVLVRAAGHLLPLDQPAWALDMITRFVDGKSFKE